MKKEETICIAFIVYRLFSNIQNTIEYSYDSYDITQQFQ